LVIRYVEYVYLGAYSGSANIHACEQRYLSLGARDQRQLTSRNGVRKPKLVACDQAIRIAVADVNELHLPPVCAWR
jgi:hypothetical protein